MDNAVYRTLSSILDNMQGIIITVTVDEFLPKLKEKALIIDACPFHPLAGYANSHSLSNWIGVNDKRSRSRNVFPLTMNTIPEIRSRMLWASDMDIPILVVLQAGCMYGREALIVLKTMYQFAYNVNIEIYAINEDDITVVTIPDVVTTQNDLIVVLGRDNQTIPTYTEIRDATNVFFVCDAIDKLVYEEPSVLFALAKRKHNSWDSGSMKITCIKTGPDSTKPDLTIRLMNLLPISYDLPYTNEHLAPNLETPQIAAPVHAVEDLAAYYTHKGTPYDPAAMTKEQTIQGIIRTNAVIIWIHYFQHSFRCLVKNLSAVCVSFFEKVKNMINMKVSSYIT